MTLIPIILCGGAGTRLWPQSRSSHPKPLLTLPDGETLLQKALTRAQELQNASKIMLVTTQALYPSIETVLKHTSPSLLHRSFILEPAPRNTAPAIAAATQHALRHDANPLLLVLPADHLISDQAAFSSAVTEAKDLAQRGHIVAFGAAPQRPETGYGYIHYTQNRAISFVEKPDLATAETYLASGDFLWNTGIFCFYAQTMAEALQMHAPEIWDHVVRSMPPSSTLDETCTILSDPFANAPNISIDYAVMQSTPNLAVVHCDMGWSDIGSWNEMALLTPPDDAGNRVQGDATLHDTQDCYVQGKTRAIGMVGVHNLIVVDTDDALLIAHRDKAQDIRALESSLVSLRPSSELPASTTQRPWGKYTVLEEGEGFKIKRIQVEVGGSLSMQMHHFRSEHWVVIAGVAKVSKEMEETIIHTHESVFIPAGEKHRLSNAGNTPLIVIEVQTGSYVGEDDIVRFDDAYGRCRE